MNGLTGRTSSRRSRAWDASNCTRSNRFCCRLSCTCSRPRLGRRLATSRIGEAMRVASAPRRGDGLRPPCGSTSTLPVLRRRPEGAADKMDGQPPQPVSPACPMTLDELLASETHGCSPDRRCVAVAKQLSGHRVSLSSHSVSRSRVNAASRRTLAHAACPGHQARAREVPVAFSVKLRVHFVKLCVRLIAFHPWSRAPCVERQRPRA